ncbi:MAG: hypothetical protein UU14_C0020G0013 [Candidatus Roizmanbacteria bacterium GW2011_GWB1_40_7]|uniref:DUF5678 domain-containing protein n=2 Tax=Candidatus Roizmaniibacteriota TaxID=1752723 RepID=A0A0G0VID5_9BACT|nr:MAG: hypothetical protein UU14_C0020G0013 [Candidatus Roizmanbacteria bacterium GW2011_GWB1_40_7]
MLIRVITMKDNTDKLIDKLLSGKAAKKYQGKQVVIIAGKAHILPDNDKASVELVNKLEKKYPKQIPHLLFVPRPETYIL